MKHKAETTEEAILRILAEAETPMGGTQVGRRLAGMGIQLNQRTVRLHLLQLDRRGLTRLVSRRGGRVLTPQGRQEAMAAAIVERLDFMATRIDALGYRMNLDLHAARGSVMLNLSFIDEREFGRAAPLVAEAFRAGLGMGRLALVRRAGQQVAGLTVREGEIVIGTVCSFTVNGALAHAGVPVRARYGGLVEIRARQPLRFTTLIDYEGTTLDPLETLVRARMTSVTQAARSGDGVIGASFREVPAVAQTRTERVLARLSALGLAGTLVFGRPNQDLLGVPVGFERTGLVVMGGMNPVAVVYEAGIELRTQAMACLVDFRELEDFEKILN